MSYRIEIEYVHKKYHSRYQIDNDDNNNSDERE